MGGFTARVDQFLVILQLLIKELKQLRYLPDKKTLKPSPINLEKSQRNMKTDLFWKKKKAWQN